MNQLKHKQSEVDFEGFIKKLFDHYNLTVDSPSSFVDRGYDFEIKDNDSIYLVEVKYSHSLYLSLYVFLNAINQLKNTSLIYENDNVSYTPILITTAKISPDVRTIIENKGIVVLDILNLLYLIQDYDNLMSELISMLDFSVNDLIPQKPNCILFNHNKPFRMPNNKGLNLKNRIVAWKTTNSSTMYENLCIDVLKYLFDNELSLWQKQAHSNDDLYRFDLICKIKDGRIGGFWKTIIDFFSSKYIIFEFKNYTDKITQKEIYTTDKYLYIKALRSVAIIISCHGTSTNADKAIRGTLRENGKLILSVSNKDLISMIDMKLNNELPSDYLYSKLDELLINLEK